jgi:hypothetical protein
VSPKIEDLLERRTDLSTFLVHFTRDYEGQSGETNLVGIIKSLAIEARNPFGLARRYADQLEDKFRTQRAVCFTETPLEHAWMLAGDIDGRAHSFTSCGLIFTRGFARRNRCNPVWYLDTTPGHTRRDWLTQPFQALIAEAVERATTDGEIDTDVLAEERIFEITPYLETMGSGRTRDDRFYRKEFHWEREWRHVEEFTFSVKDIVAVFAPEDRHSALGDRLADEQPEWCQSPRPLLDPRWGLERIISQLALGGWMLTQV